MNIQHSCAFTGHRPSRYSFGYDEENPNCIALKQALGVEIEKLVKQGVTTFYTGMALGADMWAAETVLALKAVRPDIKLVAVRPCDTQANRWAPEQQYRYYSILECVDNTILISKEYTRDCMLERNRYMVDRAQHLIAVYDGGNRGGTAYTVKYAQQLGRDIYTIHPDKYHAVVRDVDEQVQKKRNNFRITD